MFQNILVPVDLENPEFSLTALKLALRELESNPGVNIHLLAVLPGFHNPIVAAYFKESQHQAALADARTKLDAYAKQNIPATVSTLTALCEGDAAREILTYADKNAVDLIILRAHHHTRAEHFLLGSTAARVVERASCSVWTLRNDD